LFASKIASHEITVEEEVSNLRKIPMTNEISSFYLTLSLESLQRRKF
jgi:hypothetical protein